MPTPLVEFPAGVRDDEKAARGHRAGGEQRIEVAGECERDGDRVVAKGPREVLPDAASGRREQVEGARDGDEVVGGDGDGGGSAGTETEDPRRVGVGDELLPGTPQTETVEESIVDGSGDPWRFRLVVAVENAGDATYELRLDDLTLEDGDVVSGGGSTGQIPPGETGSVEGTWEIPQGTSPARVDAVGVSYGGGEETTKASRETVTLGKVPVRGG